MGKELREIDGGLSGSAFCLLPEIGNSAAFPARMDDYLVSPVDHQCIGLLSSWHATLPYGRSSGYDRTRERCLSPGNETLLPEIDAALMICPKNNALRMRNYFVIA